MKYLHIKNIDKYHPGYKDRDLKWCKAYFSMINSDHAFEMLCEIDKWRYISFIMLELQTKKPIPLDTEWLKRKGFDTKKRDLMLTINMLQTSLIVVTEDSNSRNLDKEKEEEKEREKEKFVTKVVTKKEPKHTHLDFVKLTPTEHTKLIADYGKFNADKYIKALNGHIGSKGDKYKSHYYTLINWMGRDEVKKELKRKPFTAEDHKRIVGEL